MAACMDGPKLAEIFRQATEDHQEQRYREAQTGYQKILKWVPDHFDVLHLLGQCLIQAGQPTQAVRWLNKAVIAESGNADAWYDLGLAYRKSGQNDRAGHAYRRALDVQPDFLNAHLSLVEMKFPGDHYTVILRKLHRLLKPATYLEIGVETGQSMALAEPETRCIGIDTEPRINQVLPPRCDIFAQTSDSYFAQYNVREQFGERPVEFAFIDGLHVFEAALRDFINVERCAGPDTVIAIHDCIPLDAVTSSREHTTNFWSGDIWKLILCLKKFRPDLCTATVATKPTGLGLVTGLDPANSILSECYDGIIEEFVPMTFNDIASRENEALNVMANDMQAITKWLHSSRQLSIA